MTRQQYLLIWLVTGAVAIAAAALTWPAAYWNGEIVPVGIDSFYHARRILDTVQDPSAFYEFDPRIHAPEGSLLNWPWGYDYGMARLVQLGMAVGLSQQPIEVLVWIPVAAVLITMGLLLLVCREIGLSRWTTVLAGLCLALSPATQLLHGVGQIDHHFAEYIFILAALAFGLRWLARPESVGRSVCLGLVLGTAPAIHNGLFILQLPLLCVLLVQWTQKNPCSPKGSAVLAGTLIAATLAALLPSLPFREWRFEFYTLSWFHLYVAACSAIFIVLFSRVRFMRTTPAMLGALAALLLIPLAGEIRHGEAFLSGSLEFLDSISEMQPPLRAAANTGPILLNRIYSLLIWIAPLTLLVCVAGCWLERSSRRLLFWVTCAFGLVLLSLQLRLHYFGSFALYLPLLVLAEWLAQRKPDQRKSILLVTTLGLILMYAPPLRYQLAAPMPIANDTTFVPMRPMFAALQQACAADPGIVLADNNLGHYIRYYSDCAVIADNFLMTPQHFAKMTEIKRYLSMPAAELPSVAPFIKYVLIRPADLRVAKDNQVRYAFFFQDGSRLGKDLLFDAPERVPSEFSLISEMRFENAGNAPYAKLYKVGEKRAQGASANDTTK